MSQGLTVEGQGLKVKAILGESLEVESSPQFVWDLQRFLQAFALLFCHKPNCLRDFVISMDEFTAMLSCVVECCLRVFF